MSRLTIILADLISRAVPGQPAPATRLPSGLRVAVRTLPGGARQLSLTRTGTQKPSVKEAEVCRDCAGWTLASIEAGETRAGLPCLLVTEART
ncbi:hypothetical protein QR90_06645 [Deinococcus radiopugnans]|uniref:Uncharacterized protein n=1 Tax=Deinococcus radiopugnans TaxID=57497 RepID=A0A0A7KJW6_9DEIO|nr:hypothetical protein [Deinococcus radiopugnans]AIZ44848.1 hypothetical protein QR90_06645 [Deinococcus radiopugnans]